MSHTPTDIVGELSDPVFESQNYQIIEEYVHIIRILWAYSKTAPALYNIYIALYFAIEVDNDDNCMQISPKQVQQTIDFIKIIWGILQ